MKFLHEYPGLGRGSTDGRAVRRPFRLEISPAGKGVAGECAHILSTLPAWFGNKRYRSQFAENAEAYPTLTAQLGTAVVGFITVRRHYAHSFEILCMAVHAGHRRQGIGRALLQSAEAMARQEGGKIMQVKTISPSHPSRAYAQTRSFYANAGYVPLEEFPLLWSKGNPCLQMVKAL